MMLTSTIISIISSIAVIASLVIAYRALIEVRKQRETIYLPSIVISGYEIRHKAERLGSHIAINYWRISWDENHNIHDVGREIGGSHGENFHLDFYNLGLGSAKNISIKFDIDVLEIMKEMKQIAESNNKSDVIKYSISNDWVNYETKQFQIGGGGSCIADYIFKKEINFLLPVSVNNKLTKVEFPHVLTQLIMFYNYVLFECYETCDGYYYSNGKKITTLEFPTFKLLLKYEDINNKEHNKTYSITVCNDVDGYNHGYLKIAEI